MDIRLADPSEAAEISRLVRRLVTSHIGPTLGAGGLEILLSSMDTRSTLARMTRGWPHWIALDGDQILGVVVVAPPAHLYHLFVRSERQRGGIGRRLLDEVLHLVRSDPGADRVTVNASLNSIEAYRRFGFKESSQPRDDGGVRCQPMERELPVS